MTHEPEEGRAHAANVGPSEGPAGSKNADSSSQSQSDGDAPEFKSAELALVDRLIPELPPILCRAEDWFIYGNGIWAMRTRAHYMPEALAIHPKITRFFDRETALAANPSLAKLNIQPQPPVTLPVVRRPSL